MRKFGRVLLSLVLSIVLPTLALSAPNIWGIPAAAAATTPTAPPSVDEPHLPDLPFDPHDYGNGQWLGMPSHARCDENDKGSAELLISLEDDWTGATEIDIRATAANADPSSKDSVIWSKTVTVQPGSWDAVTVPVDDRGVRIWVSEEGLSYLGSISTTCQTVPTAPTRADNTLTIPSVEDLHYFVAPVTYEGAPVEAKWESHYFTGFYSNGERLDEFSQPVTGQIAVHEVGLQVVATGPFNARIQFDWQETVTSSWSFTYDADLTIPQTPLAPTQLGNTVVLPESVSFYYVSGQGETLSAGEHPLSADLIVTAKAKDGITVANGAVTTWTFTHTSEPMLTSPPKTPPMTDGPTAAHLTAQTRGNTQMPAEAMAGSTIRVTVGDQHAGQRVRVVMFSTPRDLGTFLVGDNGTILVMLPTDIDAGNHRLAVYDAANTVLGWDPVTISPSNMQSSTSNALEGPLNTAGIALPVSTIMMAVLLLGAGAAAFILQRRRDHEPGDAESRANNPTT